MERRRLCLIAWTIAAGIVTGALSGCDSQCVTNSRPAHLVANQNKTLSFSVQSVGSNASCEWLISSNTINTRLRLTAAIFNLRSSNGTCVDNFTVYDGSSSSSPILLSTCSRPNFPIYSSGSDVMVSFTTGSDNFGTTSNFTVNYEVLKLSNATIIDSVNVDIGALHIFKYPEGSSHYPNNANRGWVFDTNDSQYVVHVVVAYVDVETASTGCNFDYVEIFDSSVEANRRDRLCGTLTSREYYSTGQSLYITFHSDGSQTRSGFNLTYTAALRSAIYPAPVCSSSAPLAAVFHNKQFLRYPAVSITYTIDRDCGWSIQSASLDYVVHVTFVYVSIPTSSDCLYSDYVQVYDGSSMLSNRLASICGNEPRQEFYSYGRSLFIQFHSSTNYIPGGFHLSYESVLRSEAPPHAGATEIVNVDLANEHFLQYPEGSSAYPNNANRGWVFYSTDPKYVVHIQFTQLDVELSATGCDFDYIEVFDSSAEEKKLDRLCGFMTRPQYYSTGEFLYLTFHSNGINVGTGFNLTYTAALQAVIYPEPVCSPSLPLAAALNDNKFLRYPPLTSASRKNNDCGWTIQSGSVNYIVHVTFLSVDIERSSECSNDHVEVHDGSPMESNILGAICGNHSQQEFYSSGQSLFIKFQTSYFTTGNFHLSYEAVLPSEVSRKTDCSYSILLSGSPQQFYFRYPENNINYNNNLDCDWIFKTDSSNYVVHVNFTFVNTEYIANCSYDYIDIFDGTPPQATGLWRLCGQLGQQREFYSTGQSLYIVFHSDPAVTGEGFRLTYTSALRSEVPQDSYGVCVQVHVQAATYSNKNLRYPYLPVNYVNNANCYWLLQTSLPGYIVSVTFTFVDIEYSNGCPYDYVQLFDGSSTFAVSLGKVCRLTSETFYSSGPSMYIRFHSDDTTTKRGFQLTYRAVSRLNIPTTPATTPFVEELSLTAWSFAEYLQYPTASASYPNNADRAWLIKTYDYVYGYDVHATFTFVDTEYSSDCVNDYIEVFDGSSVWSSSLGKLCGSTVRDFYSTGSSMYIRFHSNGAVTGRGFNLTYQAVKEAVNEDANEDTSPRILSAGVIAGPVVGGVVAIAGVVYCLTSCIRCRRCRLKQSTRNDTTNTHTNTNIHRNAAFSYPANDPVTAIPPSVNLNLVSLTVNLPPETASPPPETASPPPDIARPPSYTAEPPPPYDGNVQGASYPDAVNKPLPQKSLYPTTRQTPSAPPASQRRK